MKDSQTKKKNSIDLSQYDIAELKGMMEIIMAGGQALGQMKDALSKLYKDEKVKVPDVYYSDTVQKLNLKITKNNNAITVLEKEMMSRIKTVFPDINMFSDIDKINMEIEKKLAESNRSDQEPVVKKLSKA